MSTTSNIVVFTKDWSSQSYPRSEVLVCRVSRVNLLLDWTHVNVFSVDIHNMLYANISYPCPPVPLPIYRPGGGSLAWSIAADSASSGHQWGAWSQCTACHPSHVLCWDHWPLVPTSLVTWAGGQVTSRCWPRVTSCPGPLVTSGSGSVTSDHPQWDEASWRHGHMMTTQPQYSGAESGIYQADAVAVIWQIDR